MTAAETAREADEALVYPHGVKGQARVEMLEVYRKGQQDIKTQFARDLSHSIGLDIPAVDALIFRRAWDEGHSAGYEAVENEYDDLVTFVEEVLRLSA